MIGTRPPAVSDSPGIDPYLFDLRGFDVVRSAIGLGKVRAANKAIDELDVWDRLAAYQGLAATSGWRETGDDAVRYVCHIGQGHVQVGPVMEWADELVDLVRDCVVHSVLGQLYPFGYYVDHVSLSLATAGSPGIELHGGAHEHDRRQSYRFAGGAWDVGLSVIMIPLSPSPGPQGGTAIVAGSHKSNLAPDALPPPERFANTEWITGVPMAAGDLLVFPEAVMHGAFPWRSRWERRTLIVKAYPEHIANLGSRRRSDTEPFWPDRPRHEP